MNALFFVGFSPLHRTGWTDGESTVQFGSVSGTSKLVIDTPSGRISESNAGGVVEGKPLE